MNTTQRRWLQYGHVLVLAASVLLVPVVLADFDLSWFTVDGGGTRGDGSPGSPYADIAQAAANYPDGATLIFQAGTVNTYSGGPLTLDRPCTLKGYSITIQIGG